MNRSRFTLYIVAILSTICIIMFLLYIGFEIKGYTLFPIKTGVFVRDPIWSRTIDDIITASPARVQNRLFLRTTNAICALNATTGNQLWCTPSESTTPLSLPPYTSEGLLIIPEKDSYLSVIRQEDGVILWRSAKIDTGFVSLDNIEIQAVAFTDDMVYVARFNWKLTAYALKDGQMIWEQKMPGRTNPHLTTDGKTVYLGAGHNLNAYDTETGVLEWQIEMEGYIGQILFDHEKETLFVADASNTSILAITPNNQQIKWERKLPVSNEIGFGCLKKFDDNLIISAEEVTVISASDGRSVWQSEKLGNLECPVVIDNRMFIRNTDTLLFAFDLKTGHELGRLTVQANTPMLHEPNRSPVVVDQLLIVPVESTRVSAFHP
jgi:outer membrane protein assembly factor BamB